MISLAFRSIVFNLKVTERISWCLFSLSLTKCRVCSSLLDNSPSFCSTKLFNLSFSNSTSLHTQCLKITQNVAFENDHFWHYQWTFVHSKCKRSSLRSQFWMSLLLQFQNSVQGWKELTAWPGIVTLGVWKGPLSVSMLCLPYWYGRGRRSGINASDWACLVSDGRLCNRPRKSPMSRFTTRSLTRIIIQGFANTQSRLFRILWTFHIR